MKVYGERGRREALYLGCLYTSSDNKRITVVDSYVSHRPVHTVPWA